MSLNITTAPSFSASYSGISIGAVLLVVCVGTVILALSFLRVFKLFNEVLGKAGRVLVLTLKGSLIAGTSWGLYLLWGYVLSLGEAVGFEPMWILYGAGGVAGFSLLGYAGERVYTRIEANIRTLYPRAETIAEVLGEGVHTEEVNKK